MHVCVQEMLFDLEKRWVKSCRFLDSKKERQDKALSMLDPLRLLIVNPHAEIEEAHWAKIESALLCGFEVRAAYDSELHFYAMLFAIAGFINASQQHCPQK